MTTVCGWYLLASDGLWAIVAPLIPASGVRAAGLLAAAEDAMTAPLAVLMSAA